MLESTDAISKKDISVGSWKTINTNL